MNLVQVISDAGDSAVLIPLAAMLVALLWRYQGWKAALALLFALAACATMTIVLKLAFIACGQTWHAGIASPSGHASMSAAVYGALGLVGARHASRWLQPPILLASWCLIIGVAVSRVFLGAHSYAEVVVGLLVGVTALALFAWRYFSLRKLPMSLGLLAALSLITVLVFNGLQLPIEQLIHKVAYFGRASTGVCAGG